MILKVQYLQLIYKNSSAIAMKTVVSATFACQYNIIFMRNDFEKFFKNFYDKIFRSAIPKTLQATC